ncbi:MAG TPA: BatA domain-containing protein [Pirellulales bacterium]|jgi:hypothetical protein|nr:BatA domain-containing protein [Pirellulales bacterium]
MPAFINPLLLWGLALMAVPVFIHLINLVRHRRVRWGAMEFLLASQRKNSRWIRIKELILLLLRVGAVAAVVLVLAQPLWSDSWRLGIGGQAIEHVVLLDDSFSMSDRWADTSAFDQAKQAIGRLAEHAAQQDTPQRFTLVRFSWAASATGADRADLLQQRVDRDFAQRLGERIKPWQPSHASAGPARAIAVARELLGPPDAARRVVYLVTDFRTNQWNEPAGLAAGLASWTADGAQLQFIDCVDASRPNLAITALLPDEGTRAADVDLPLHLGVKNFGTAPVRDLAVTVEQEGGGHTSLKFDEIPAGQTVTRSLQVLFPTAGVHVVAARLPSDAVAVDNARYAAIDMPVTVPVLVVDGDSDQPDARLLAAALNPGGSVKTGVDVRVEPPAFLNTQPLAGYSAIYLLGVERLDEHAVSALERYVRDGGGVAFFMGPRVAAQFYNQQLYRDGAGIFPAPLVGATQLIVDRLEKIPDLSVNDHTIFKALAGERNSFLSAVTIERFMLVAKDWQPPADSSVRVLATLRNGSPLAIERRFGTGRVLALLTTAGPAWNNWARNPSFVVTLLQMQAWLGAASVQQVSLPVGSPLVVKLDPTRYDARAQFTPPADSGLPPTALDLTAGPEGLEARYTDTGFAGIYEAQLTETNGRNEARRWALNVDPEEGNLATLDATQLAARLPKLHYTFHDAARFVSAPRDAAGSNLSDLLLYALVALLVGEQALAYAASYHLPASERVLR